MSQAITDANLTAKDVSNLTSRDAAAAFLASLGYDSSIQKRLSPEERGLIRATCSVSDPFDVLEAKICGADADTEPEHEGSEGD